MAGTMTIVLGKAAKGAVPGPDEGPSPSDRGTPDAFADENIKTDLEVAMADFAAAGDPKSRAEALMNFLDIREQLRKAETE